MKFTEDYLCNFATVNFTFLKVFPTVLSPTQRRWWGIGSTNHHAEEVIESFGAGVQGSC